MSILNDYPFIELTDFGGAWIYSDPSVVQRQGGLLARNVDFAQGEVGTRKGFSSTGLDWKVPPGVGGNPVGGVSDLVGSMPASDMYAWFGPFSNQDGALLGTHTDQLLAWFSPAFTGPFPEGNPQALCVGDMRTMDLAFLAYLSGAAGATMVGAGLRLYVVLHDYEQHHVSGGSGPVMIVHGKAEGGVWRFTSSPGFRGPSGYAPVPVLSGGGLITEGVHRAGYLIEYNTGFTTRVSPDSGLKSPPDSTTFLPIEFAATASLNQATFSWLMPDPPGGDYLPADCVAVTMVMTTKDNLHQYYVVPGSRKTREELFGIPGTPGPGSTTISISDDDLSSTGADATPYLYWLTVPPSGLTAIYCSYLCLWGDRMAYKAYLPDNEGNRVDAIYVSERSNYQAITLDQHVIQIPGQRSITTIFRMGTVNYILGPHEIYSVMDNGDVPVTWPTPHLVDGRHGTLALKGFEVSPSGNYAWIADQGGLFLFTGGPITELPISYEQTPDWQRINWDAAYCIEIRDDSVNKRVYVMVPMDAATTPSHIMMWEYSSGISYDRVRYSLQDLGAYPMGCMELVRNDMYGQSQGNQKKIELWLASTLAGFPFLRQMSDLDLAPLRYLDNGQGINSVYRATPLPGRLAGQGLIHMHHGFKARLTGDGLLRPRIYDIEGSRFFECRVADLDEAPNQDELFLADLNSEHAFVEFASNSASTYWNLAYLCWYYSPWLIQR